MSRVFTIVVILLLMAVVALVPRMGTEDRGPDLGDGYAYREDTLARFRLLLEDDAWALADPPRNPQGMLEAVHEKTMLTFVLIPAGSFMMGAPEDEEGSYMDEAPVHRVAVRPFLLSSTECTQSSWRRGGGEDCSYFKGAKRPVESACWRDYRSWCDANGLRLPSESEWEYACRAGGVRRWCFGDDESRLVEYAWFDQNSAGRTHPVGQKLANSFGLHDMHGNVWEWCEDWFGPYEEAPSDGSPRLTKGSAGNRVFRGASYYSSQEWHRSASRLDAGESYDGKDIGFRPAGFLPYLENSDGD